MKVKVGKVYEGKKAKISIYEELWEKEKTLLLSAVLVLTDVDGKNAHMSNGVGAVTIIEDKITVAAESIYYEMKILEV